MIDISVITELPNRYEILGKNSLESKDILVPEALEFISQLHEKFNVRRKELLERRKQFQQELDGGKAFEFLDETKAIRTANWTIAKLPDDLQDRRVEITGPVDRKMIINALNSGAKTFMADFEDATSPSWKNIIEGQYNLRDAVRGTIEFTQENTGKHYQLNEETAVLMVRARGWHLTEKHFLINGEPISASLFDFGLYFFHNAQTLLKKGTRPYFYLPKIEHYLEARLWNDVFRFAQQQLTIPQGTIKATVLIETLPAAFQMDEILYELREHSAGLNCGRWDYIFSFIKRFQQSKEVIFPNRDQVTMTVPFMRAYTQLCIKTCHKRNAPAIGGMAAQIPIRHDEEANIAAFEKVKEDKRREAQDGHDGTWVAHPGLVPIALAEFNKYMPTPNQIDNKREDIHVTAEQLIEIPTGTITEEGLRLNINVAIQYIASWYRGNGAAPINNLMEDAATAEISRSQVWQWIRHPEGILPNGEKITQQLVYTFIQEELEKLKKSFGEDVYKTGQFVEASELFRDLIREDEFEEFLTIPGYLKL